MKYHTAWDNSVLYSLRMLTGPKPFYVLFLLTGLSRTEQGNLSQSFILERYQLAVLVRRQIMAKVLRLIFLFRSQQNPGMLRHSTARPLFANRLHFMVQSSSLSPLHNIQSHRRRCVTEEQTTIHHSIATGWYNTKVVDLLARST
jgi:hypothetical protein